MNQDFFLRSLELSKRHKKALSSLSYECDYDPDNFIVYGKIGPYIGDKTMGDLIDWGLVVEGKCKWFGERGFRITDLGRKADMLK